MDRKLSYRAMLGLSVSLALLPVKAWAEFIIEFTDGRQVTVGRYIDEGQTIKIYTPQGTIGFRKGDVKRITEVDRNHSTNTPLETVRGQTLPPAEASAPASSNTEKGAGEGKTTKVDKGGAARKGKSTEADLERLEEQYQEAGQRHAGIWKKHMQDLHSGASDDELAENRRMLIELDQEEKALVKKARQARPDDLPDWAR